MDCESPSSSNQLRAAAPSAQVSLGYTRAQVCAPLPHSSSGSWTSDSRADDASTSPAQRRSSHRHSYAAASPPHSISSQLQSQPNVLIRPQGVADVMLDNSSGGGGNKSELLALQQRHQTLAPAAAAAPEATQSGSMNLPLYHVTSHPPPHHVVPPGGHHVPTSQLHAHPSSAPYQLPPGGHLPPQHGFIPTSLQQQPFIQTSTAPLGVNISVNERSLGGAEASARVRTSGGGGAPEVRGGGGAAAAERSDDSPMMGVCVQQSPVASH